MFLDFLDSPSVNQRPMCFRCCKAVTELILRHGIYHHLNKAVVYRSLEQNMVSTYARLSQKSKLARNQALQRGIQIGIFKYYKRRISFKLKRQLL